MPKLISTPMPSAGAARADTPSPLGPVKGTLMQTSTATSTATSTGSNAGLREMNIRHRSLDSHTCVVSPEGEVDIASAPALKGALLDLLGHGYRQFVLDLSQVTHMDSTGLGVLIGFERRLKDEGTLVLAAAPPNVLVVLDVTGLDARFALFPSIDEALGHLGKAAHRSRRPALSTDAAMAIGLASTALPFAESPLAEAERWLRILGRHGDAGRALCGSELSDASRSEPSSVVDPAPIGLVKRDIRDVIERVIARAALGASRRRESKIGTGDLLLAVMEEYGPDFDRVLRANGVDKAAVIERVGGVG